MRTAQVERKTRETDIKLSLDLDNKFCQINTGIGFFDHMLTALAVHGNFGLKVEVKGDLEVDCHHTVEDTGIVLGKAFSDALGDKSGIERYASFYIPMDEAMAFCSLDISGRPFLKFDVAFPQEKIGDFDACMVEEFMRAFAFNSGITLHINSLYGSNSHHIAEAIFKALAHSIKIAVRKTDGTVLSTKGIL